MAIVLARVILLLKTVKDALTNNDFCPESRKWALFWIKQRKKFAWVCLCSNRLEVSTNHRMTSIRPILYIINTDVNHKGRVGNLYLRWCFNIKPHTTNWEHYTRRQYKPLKTLLSLFDIWCVAQMKSAMRARWLANAEVINKQPKNRNRGPRV